MEFLENQRRMKLRGGMFDEGQIEVMEVENDF
jgi:hypothetical protein